VGSGSKQAESAAKTDTSSGGEGGGGGDGGDGGDGASGGGGAGGPGTGSVGEDPVTVAIREAQAKVLEGEGKLFSDTAVRVKVQGGSQRVVLKDMPGLVRDNPEMGEVVRRMVRHHIKPEETLVVVALEANRDVQTQEAQSLAQAQDARSERTLAVLTKCDEVQHKDKKAALAVSIAEAAASLRRGET
jgi:Dynamin family